MIDAAIGMMEIVLNVLGGLCLVSLRRSLLLPGLLFIVLAAMMRAFA